MVSLASLAFHADSLILNRTLTYLFDTCFTCANLLQCPDAPDVTFPPCPHSTHLANCLTVSRAWFNAAGRHLWQNYAMIEQLLPLIEPDPNVRCLAFS